MPPDMEVSDEEKEKPCGGQIAATQGADRPQWGQCGDSGVIAWDSCEVVRMSRKRLQPLSAHPILGTEPARSIPRNAAK
jgi:hypothetical protein